MVYRWREHGNRFRVKAQVVGERIEQIRESNGGRIRPDDIVNDARAKSSPLHRAFEWNNAKAAEAYRLEQARFMLGAIVIVHEAAPNVGPVRAFVNIREGTQQSYTSTEDAMTVPDLRRQVIARALREAKEWRRRYQQYTELGTVFSAIDAAEQTVAA
jgi:hypothetical protein